jgi:hypothetical protein
MCMEVTMYKAKSGRTYETPIEALKDDLTQLVMQTADNLPIAEKLVAGMLDNASAYSILMVKIADKMAQLPGLANTAVIELPCPMPPSAITAISGLRTVQTDTGFDIFIDNKRIGFIEADKLHLIGADGYSHEVADCTHIDQVAGLVAQHYHTIS